MANSYTNGVVYLDTASAQAVATSNRLKVKYAVLIPNSAGDTATIKQASSDTNPSISLKAGVNGQAVLDFSREPIIMNGIYLDSISSNAVVLLYTTSRGGS